MSAPTCPAPTCPAPTCPASNSENGTVLYHRPAQTEAKIVLHGSGVIMESSKGVACRTIDGWINLAFEQANPEPPPRDRPLRHQKFVTRRVVVNASRQELARSVEKAVADNDARVQDFTKTGFADVLDVDGYKLFPGAEIISMTSAVFVRPHFDSWHNTEISAETIVAFKEAL